MYKSVILFLLIFLAVVESRAQGEEAIWTFGDVGIDFNQNPPVAYPNNLFPGYEGSASVCDTSGQLLFYTNGFWVWNRAHELLPELTGGIGGYTRVISPSVGYPPLIPWTGAYATQPTAIAQMPGHPSYYYLFSLTVNGQLFYSVLDRTLHNGMGGIVAGKKSVFLAAGLCEKLTVVKGCHNIWVMTRSKTANEFKAFELNDTGIVSTPVVSVTGQLPLNWYRCGVLKFSPDGRKMAAASNAANLPTGGLELYDFDPLTGTLSGQLVLDSSSTQGYYYGACFSPDNSKLYAVTSSYAFLGSLAAGKVHQFDLSAPTPGAVIASHTIVYTNTVSALDNLGDLKRAPDGKIYFGNGLSEMHAITQPNNAGAACNPMAGVLTFPAGATYRGLPNDLAFAPVPDSAHRLIYKTACFTDSMELVADSGKYYQWENGFTQKIRRVYGEGYYTVRYLNAACVYQTDSFYVRFVKLPLIAAGAYSCPGGMQGRLSVQPYAGDTTLFRYTWQDAQGIVLKSSDSRSGDYIEGLDTGTYYLHLNVPGACDTVLQAKVLSLPVPVAAFSADSIICVEEAVLPVKKSDAPLWKWYFGDGSRSGEADPVHSYPKAGTYRMVLEVTNLEGCSDTAFQKVEVKEFELFLDAAKTLVEPGESLLLQTTAKEAYTPLSWKPAFLFPDQEKYSQVIEIDTTTEFVVTGRSLYGCEATASLTIAVPPIVWMPVAFTPNGDGRNDRFRPLARGSIFIQLFEIYNRFGQQVFYGVGDKAAEGWDGSFKGQPQELGTYYYQIKMETKQGTIRTLKGDVTLIR